MTIADQYIISVLKHEDINLLGKVNDDWFDEDELPRFRYVKEYFKEHAELPGVKSFCKMFSFDANDVDSRPTFYLKKLKDRFLFTQLAEKIPDFLKSSKKAPQKSFDELKKFVSELGSQIENKNTKDVLYSDNIEERFKRYEERTLNKGIDYVSMGHPLLDELFQGYHRNDLITIAGRAGMRKSWLLLFLILLLDKILPEDFGEILFISNEMGEEELQDRLDCLNYKLPFSDFNKGILTRAKKREYREGLNDLRYLNSRIRIIYNCNTLEEVESKIAIYSPTAVFIDGSYLLEPEAEEDWKKIVKITRNLKRMALNNHIPIINTTQMKRKTGRKKSSSFDAQDAFAFSNAYTQDSDLAMTMFQDDMMIYNQEVGMNIAKGRKVPPNTELIFCCNLNNMIVDFKISEDTNDEEPNTDW